MKGNAPGALLVGPALLLLLLAVLSAYALLLVASGQLNGLVSLGRGAARRLRRGRGLLVFWGLSSALLVVILAVTLFKIKPLALLGLAVLLVGLTLAGLGLCVAALRAGSRLAAELTLPGASPTRNIILGILTLLLASIVPVLGWVVVALLAAGGLGAVLEELFSRR